MEHKELKKQAANVLDDLEAKGRILVFTALIESELEEALIAYFATSGDGRGTPFKFPHLISGD